MPLPPMPPPCYAAELTPLLTPPLRAMLAAATLMRHVRCCFADATRAAFLLIAPRQRHTLLPPFRRYAMMFSMLMPPY